MTRRHGRDGISLCAHNPLLTIENAMVRDTEAGADTSQYLLQARNVDAKYGGSQILGRINLRLNSGDTLGLLGLNGAGKSTLLKVLAGVQAASNGDVLIAGANLRNEPLAARQAVGYAPDKPPVYAEFTVIEYLRFAARLRRISKQQLLQAVDHVIDRCGLGDVRHRIIGNLSHGYQQRVNLAQALIHKPKVLILDEPANGLDPAQLIEMRALVSESGQDHATIFSSHLLPEVQATCNRVFVLHQGEKILDMPMDQLTGDKHSTFEVVLQQAAVQEDLIDLPGVLAVRSVDPQHWLLTTRASGNTKNRDSDTIGKAMLARGIKLLEVNPVRNQLERIFNQLKHTQNQTVGDAG